MKTMTNTIFLFLFIIILVISGIIIGLKQENKSAFKRKALYTINSKIPYYKSKFKKRYLKYQEKNPTLSKEEIVTHVNIGLDQKYYTNTKKSPHLNKDYILVNKYLYLEKDYVPDNLEDLPSDYARENMKLVKQAKNAFIKLVDTAKKEGFNIRAISSYRSYNYQLNLYNRYKQTDGQEKADTYSARPGYSEHQTGLVVDVDNNNSTFEEFESTKEFKWMQENAYKYGFILRYPEGKENITGYQYESWHYRYVGKKAAKDIYKNNITFDEYYIMKIETKY